MRDFLVLDVSTAPIADAAAYIEGGVKAPSNWKDPAKIAEYIAEKEAERLSMAAVDCDLARITGAAWAANGQPPFITLAADESHESILLSSLAALVVSPYTTIVTYGGLNFDIPVLMRRARYLGVKFPIISTDRYRSPVVDLCEVLSDRNPQRRRPLGFYVRRLGWTDLSKPLSGEEESKVHQTGQWDALAASLHHDCTATYRLALWLGIIAPEPSGAAL